MSLVEFEDLPSTDTPINAANLNNNFNELAELNNINDLSTISTIDTQDLIPIVDVSESETKKVSISSLKSNINAYTKSVDNNGWTVVDFGTHKEYYKKGVNQVTVSGGGWSAGIFGVNIPADLSSISDCVLTSSIIADDGAITTNIGANSDSTSILVNVTNQYGSSVTTNVRWQVRLVKY